MLVGLVSTYAEGNLGEAAVRSLEDACARIFIAEGPIGEQTEVNHDWGEIRRDVVYGLWVSDAAKRNALLRFAQNLPYPDVWVVSLDGDEQLLNGHNLPLWVERARAGDDDLRVHGGFPIRLVELDGSTSQALNRVYRADAVDSYVHSSCELRLAGGGETSISAGNVINWRPGDQVTGYNRPPLQGEPHILHLSELRDPARRARRQSELELEDYAIRAKKIGIELPDWAAA